MRCHRRMLMLLLLLLSLVVRSLAEDGEEPDDDDDNDAAAVIQYDDDYSDDASDDYFHRAPVDSSGWLEGFQGGLGFFLLGMFLVVFILHTILQPQYMMMHYMNHYLTAGDPIMGTALECAPITASGGHSVKIMYECCEHKHADNPTLKFRFPSVYQDKKFVQHFVFSRPTEVGEGIPVLLPMGRIVPRSGCPKEVVEDVLKELAAKRQRRIIVLSVGIVIVLILLGFCIARVLLMKDSPARAATLFVGVIVIEVVSFLYCSNEFLKRKRIEFDSAKPMRDDAENAKEGYKVPGSNDSIRETV